MYLLFAYLVSQNVETVDFDDFGVDLYPGPEATVFGSDLDADKYTCRPGYEPNTGITRFKCFISFARFSTHHFFLLIFGTYAYMFF